MNFFSPVAGLPDKYLVKRATGPALQRVSALVLQLINHVTGLFAFPAPVIIECCRPDSAEINADLVGTRCRGMTTTPALSRPRRRPFMNDIPINTIFTVC